MSFLCHTPLIKTKSLKFTQITLGFLSQKISHISLISHRSQWYLFILKEKASGIISIGAYESEVTEPGM